MCNVAYAAWMGSLDEDGRERLAAELDDRDDWEAQTEQAWAQMNAGR